MVRLGEADVRRLTQVAFELGQACPLPDFPRRTVRLAAQLVGADVVALTEVAPAEGRSQGYMEPNESWVHDEADEFSPLFAEHPIIEYFGRTGDGSARCISDFLTVDEYHSRGIYQQFYRRLGAEEQLAATFIAGHGIFVGLTFNRGSRTFTERDRLVVDILGSTVAAAHHRSHEVWRIMQTMATQSRESAEGFGLVVLDAQRRPVHAWGAAATGFFETFELDAIGQMANSLAAQL